MSEPEQERKVDEAHEARVDEEKKQDEHPLPQADFLTLVVSLAGQATIHMGLVEHPIAKKVQKDLRQARYTIDLLGILEKKTQGNLTPEEKSVMERLLADLRLKFVQASG